MMKVVNDKFKFSWTMARYCTGERALQHPARPRSEGNKLARSSSEADKEPGKSFPVLPPVATDCRR